MVNTPKDKHQASVLFTGDIGLTESCLNNDGMYSSELLSLFSEADAVCINLELPFTPADCRMAPYTHPSLKSLPEASSLLALLHPTVVNIGTNHCMDGYGEGIKKTRNLIQELEACPVGAGLNEKEARKPCFINTGNFRLCFLSYCKEGTYTARSETPGAALLSEGNLRTDIPLYSQDCDHLVVSLHMGMEFSKHVHPIYRQFAHLCVDLGASCVVGHHPHVIQGIEVYNDAPIFYSLGNFLFDNYAGAVTYRSYWEDRHRSIVARVVFSGNSVTHEVIPVTYTSRPMVVRIADESDSSNIRLEVERLSDSIGTDIKETEADAFNAIAKREIATIWELTKIHGFRFLWHLARTIRLRHFRMLYRAAVRKIKGS